MHAWKFGYEKAKQKALTIYAGIGSIQCHTFNGESIYFTRVGFSHLIRKGKNPRTRTQQKKRFCLIPYVGNILKNTDAVIEYRKEAKRITVDRRGKKVTKISVAQFWTFVEKIGDCTVKVVIRQLDTGGPKHFFSVMGSNVAIVSRKRKNKKSRH